MNTRRSSRTWDNSAWWIALFFRLRGAGAIGATTRTSCKTFGPNWGNCFTSSHHKTKAFPAAEPRRGILFRSLFLSPYSEHFGIRQKLSHLRRLGRADVEWRPGIQND